MKNIKFLGLFLAFVMLFSSCESDEYLDYETGADVTISTTEGQLGFFDFVDINSAIVSLDLLPLGDANVSSVDIYKSFNGGDAVKHATVNLPASVSINAAEACEGLDVTPADLQIGDVFELSFQFNTDRGTLLTGTTYDAVVKCVSDLGGTYEMFSDILFADNGPQQYTEMVELVDDGGGVYTFFDITGNAWGVNYAELYGASAREAVIVDVCDVLSVASVPDQFGFEIVVDEISLNPDTGVITWSWSDTGYDDNGVVTLTPQ